MNAQDKIKKQIADKQKRMKALNELVAKEERMKSEEERSEFDTLKNEVAQLRAELEDLEVSARMETEVEEVEAPAVHTKKHRFNVAKAVRQAANGRIDGFEGEMHAEGLKRFGSNAQSVLPSVIIPDEILSKRAQTYANSSGLITEKAESLDILSNMSFYEKIGTTVFRNATDVIKLSFAAPIAAGKKAESAAADLVDHTKVTQKLEPTRFTSAMLTTKENMSVNSFIEEMIIDHTFAIGHEITKDLIAAILADVAVPLTGFTAASTAAALTWPNVNKLKAALVKISQFRRPGYLAGMALYAEMETIIKGGTGSGRFILEDGKIGGSTVHNVENVLGVHDTNKYDLIYGDWARSYVAEFGGGLEIVVNPYTNVKQGEVEIVFCRLADVAYNPNAFKAIANATVS